jgi:hypothetical protein
MPVTSIDCSGRVVLGVDGGVTRANIDEVAALGVDLVVSGSAASPARTRTPTHASCWRRRPACLASGERHDDDTRSVDRALPFPGWAAARRGHHAGAAAWTSISRAQHRRDGRALPRASCARQRGHRGAQVDRRRPPARCARGPDGRPSLGSPSTRSATSRRSRAAGAASSQLGCSRNRTSVLAAVVLAGTRIYSGREDRRATTASATAGRGPNPTTNRNAMVIAGDRSERTFATIRSVCLPVSWGPLPRKGETITVSAGDRLPK